MPDEVDKLQTAVGHQRNKSNTMEFENHETKNSKQQNQYLLSRHINNRSS